MNIQEHAEKIIKAENTVDVNRFIYRGVHLWPLVRYHVLLQFLNPEAYFSLQKKETTGTQGFLSFLVLFPYRLFKKIVYGLLHSMELGKIQVSGAMFFYSEPKNYQDVLNGKFYNKLIDPFVEYFERKHIPVFKFEWNESQKGGKLLPPFLFTKNYFEKYSQLSEELVFNRQVDSLEGIMNDLILSTGIDLNKKIFRDHVKNIFRFVPLMAGILKRSNPQKVFLSCYYGSPYTLALLLASRKAGIATIDIQHGKQGNYHPMVSHWSKIPVSGYDLLPAYFWNWGKESAENINKWFPPGMSKHKTIVGGNLWLAKWKSTDFYVPAKDEKVFLERFRNYEKVILFTAQPLKEESFPRHLIEAIEKSPESWLWLIRLHPLHKNRTHRFFELVKDNQNVEITQATSLPLYLLLKNCHHHVTCWSSVAVEALQFGVPTTIVHPNGKTIFKEYIDRNVFSFSAEPGDLIGLIQESRKQDFKDEYVVSDMKSMDEAMNIILNDNA